MSLSGGGAATNDPNDDNAASSPFKWTIVPVGILIVAAIVVTILRVRKRNKQRGSHGLNALQRDVEAMGPNRVRRTGDSRWQWADGTRTGRRVGLGVGSRDEGLNELGEAPPAYSPPAKSPEHVELHDMTASRVTPQSNTAMPSSFPQTTSPNDATPPSYGEARASDSMAPQSRSVSDLQHPTAPAPVVLPPR